MDYFWFVSRFVIDVLSIYVFLRNVNINRFGEDTLFSEMTESSMLVNQWLTLELGFDLNLAVVLFGGVALLNKVFSLP
jgi:hypothetical protein